MFHNFLSFVIRKTCGLRVVATNGAKVKPFEVSQIFLQYFPIWHKFILRIDFV